MAQARPCCTAMEVNLVIWSDVENSRCCVTSCIKHLIRRAQQNPWFQDLDFSLLLTLSSHKLRAAAKAVVQPGNGCWQQMCSAKWPCILPAMLYSTVYLERLTERSLQQEQTLRRGHTTCVVGCRVQHQPDPRLLTHQASIHVGLWRHPGSCQPQVGFRPCPYNISATSLLLTVGAQP